MDLRENKKNIIKEKFQKDCFSIPKEIIISKKLRIIIYYIWPTILFLQWLIIIPLIKTNSIYISIETSCDYKRIVPFLKDYFFIFWNLLPFGLAFGIRLSEQSFMRALLSGTKKNKLHEMNEIVKNVTLKWDRVMFSVPFLLAALSLAFIGSFIQFVKVARMTVNFSSLYWWQMNSIIFYVRIGALFGNLFCLLFALFTFMSLVHSFSKVTNARLFDIDLLHVDGCGGLSKYGKAALYFTMVPFLAEVNALLGYFDHRGYGIVQFIGDTSMLIFATVIGVAAFILPLKPIHRSMSNAKSKECHIPIEEIIKKFTPMIQKTIKNGLETKSFQSVGSIKKDRDSVIEIYQLFSKASTWPINLKTWTRFSGAVGGPLFIYFIDLMIRIIVKL